MGVGVCLALQRGPALTSPLSLQVVLQEGCHQPGDVSAALCSCPRGRRGEGGLQGEGVHLPPPQTHHPSWDKPRRFQTRAARGHQAALAQQAPWAPDTLPSSPKALAGTPKAPLVFYMW